MHDAAAFDALAAQVNQLARVCARLTRENAELRSQVSALSAPAMPAMPATPATPATPAAPAWPAMSATPMVPAPEARTDGGPTARISRRAAVGVALAGAAAGIAGVTAVTERSGREAPAAAGAEPTRAELTGTGPTGTGPTGTESTVVEQAAVEQAAAPTTTGSLINGTLSSASAVVAAGNTSTGPGVHATSGGGRGGIFGGGAAQIQLTPAGSSHPKSGQRGDLYADAAGRLWYCKTTGATAAWHQIA